MTHEIELLQQEFRSAGASKTQPRHPSQAGLGVMQGEYHWHKHDDLDEFFFVLEGSFLIDLENRTVVPERATILLFEDAGVIPTGDE